LATSVPQLQPPLHFATCPFAHARPPIVAALAEKSAFGAGVSSCLGETVVYAPPDAPGRTWISSQRLSPVKAVPKSSATVKSPPLTATSSRVTVGPIWPAPVAAS
jgi:hypothetical protein